MIGTMNRWGGPQLTLMASKRESRILVLDDGTEVRQYASGDYYIQSAPSTSPLYPYVNQRVEADSGSALWNALYNATGPYLTAEEMAEQEAVEQASGALQGSRLTPGGWVGLGLGLAVLGAVAVTLWRKRT